MCGYRIPESQITVAGDSYTGEIPASAHGQRLDKWLADEISDVTRSQLQRLIREGALQLNHEVITDGKVKLSSHYQRYTLTPPAIQELELEPVAMQLDILFEDDQLIVLNKPSGLTVHPAASEKNPTLVHGLLAHCGDSLSGIGGVQRPGIVHRLDKDTSGAILIAKTDKAHQHLSAQLQDRSLSRTYHALCYGRPQVPAGTIDAPIGRSTRDRKKMAVVEADKGKAARTHYRVMESYGDSAISLIECKLESGRTHQIRVHLTHLGYPLLGDPTYGRARKLKDPALQALIAPLSQQMLHAISLCFIHPITQQRIEVQAPYREAFSTLLAALS